jgi:hypothetical protein
MRPTGSRHGAHDDTPINRTKPEYLTLLRAPDVLGAKRFTPAGVVPYSSGAGPFQVFRFQVADLDAAIEILKQCPPDAYMVRGCPRPEEATTLPNRRHVDRPGAPGTLRPEGHRLLPIDWDGEDADLDGTNLLTSGSIVREYLPEWLRPCRCYVHATSSAGIKPGARLRLWFWMDRPLSDKECKWALSGYVKDLKIYSPSQPIYVASPTFDGVEDPFAGRSRWL